MHQAVVQLDTPNDAPPGLETALKARLSGSVRFDRLFKALYATDASIYEIIPLGVVFPRDTDDVVSTVKECCGCGVPVVARGAGTGLTGGAVGAGVQLDLSRHMNRIGRLDTEARTIEVGPGVVLDELNGHLAPSGLRFAPDVATSSRATVGGMIANNSCGANSVLYGRTVDHVAELTVVMHDGGVVRFGSPEGDTPRVATIRAGLAEVRNRHYDEIQKRFPKVMRSNGGYGLDRLGPPGSTVDPIKVLCGSEGTLGVVVSAKLRLIGLPKHTGVLVVQFDGVLEALQAAPAILTRTPAAVELVDRLIIEAGLANAAIAPRCTFLSGTPEAILIVELHDEDQARLESRLMRLASEAGSWKGGAGCTTVLDPGRQADVWKLRTSGLGLLMSRPGDEQPYSFIEDTAVDPARLRDYIERLGRVLDAEGVHAGYYAHASVGCIHVKPVLNLKLGADVERMKRIAEAVADLAVSAGGTITGEHGDGLVRSSLLERMYGPTIMQAFRAVKLLFDPNGVLNPGKIVDAPPITQNLRYGSSFQTRQLKTHLDFEAYGGMAGLAGMCSGVGQCRQRLVGTMCPSFMGTDEEVHTTRGRANALRMAMSNRGLLEGLDDPALDEVMDLCISCKACKTECPTGTDMARIKAEFLARRNMLHGVPRRSRLIADVRRSLARASRVPRLSNWFAQARWMRLLMERRYGLSRQIPPPRLATRTFSAWWRRHVRRRGRRDARPRGDIVYFVDTWTEYITPQVGIATIKLLEAAGLRVHCPAVGCCGRPAISQGLLIEAGRMAAENVGVLAPWASAGAAIIGTEPSCISALVDEYPQLIRTSAARAVAAKAVMADTYLARLAEREPDRLSFTPAEAPLLFHGHCHQKALFGTQDSMSLLRRAWGERADEINSGCCGMAGSFGHEVEHYDTAEAIGRQRLFPAIEQRPEAQVAVCGFSCRHQIHHHTGVSPKHVVECAADCLAAGIAGG